MEYVMVPVPEEHRQEVMDEIMKISIRQKLVDFDEPTLRTILDESPEDSHALIAVLTQASVDNRRLARPVVAERIGVAVPQLAALSRDINERCSALSAPYLILTAPPEGGEAAGTGQEVLLITNAAAVILRPMLRPDAEEPASPS